ncbi:MAG: hypothetical protein FJ308_00845 [Planctomycetes bacterium]|nr:hypothetical protein [Planctomycetota bacterium]
MSLNPEEIDLLLNGLLDGALTDEEQSRIELAMEQDPELGVRFEEMTSLRRSLLVGRRSGRLGSDFAKRVVLAARERADLMGDEAPAWLRPTPSPDIAPGNNEGRKRGRREQPVTSVIASRSEVESQSSEPQSSESDSVIISKRAWRVWLPAMSMVLAASVAMVMFSVMWPPSPPVQPFAGTSEVPQGSDDSSANDVATDLLNTKEKDSVSRPGIASNSNPSSDANRGIGASDSQLASSNPTDSIENGSTQEMASTLAEASQPSLPPSLDKPDDPRSKAIDDLIASKSIANPIFTLVAEITVDSVAAENDSLRTLIEEHEILVTDDLNLEKNQLETLVSSQLVGALNQVDVGDRDGVQMFFLRARADRIDSFLMDTFAQYNDFPSYRLDLSFDPAVLNLANQLSTVASSDDYARRLTFRGNADSGLVTMFPHVDKGSGVKLEDRIAASQSRDRSMTKERREMSYLLLMVKPAAAK